MEQNSQFRVDKVLLPCRVTRSLVAELEKAIAPLLNDIVSGCQGKVTTRIVISDASGDETLNSSAAIITPLFSDSTSELQIEVIGNVDSQVPGTPGASVRIRFRAESPPALRIVVQSPRAREQALGMLDRIYRILDSYSEGSKWLRASRSTREAILLFGALIAIFCLLVVWDAVKTGAIPALPSRSFLFWSVLAVCLLGYVFVSGRFFPACAFDTKTRARLDEQKTWAKRALWSLIYVDLLVLLLGGLLLEQGRLLWSALW